MNQKTGWLAVSLIVLSLFMSGCIRDDTDEYTGDENWNLTLEWDGNTEHMSLSEIRKMPSYTGHAYLVSTTGIRYGPYIGTGALLSDIIRPMGELNETSRLYLYGSEEYLWVLDNIQLKGGGYITFDENLSETENQIITPVLMYELDGKPLSEEDGGPVRFALLSENPGVITEGSGWVKWVSKLELHR